MSTLGDLTMAKVDQSGPPRAGEFTYVDISSVDNRLKRIIDPKRLAVAAAPSRARQCLRAGDVLVSMTRPNLNAVAIIPTELDGAIGSTGFHVLRALEGIEPRWLFYSVQTRNFVESMSGLVQGALYPAVRPKDIRAFSVEVPSLDDQRRAVAEIEKQFSRLDEAITILKHLDVKLHGYSDAVLEKEFTKSSKWPFIQVGEVCQAVNGRAFKSSEWRDSGVPIIRIQNLKDPSAPFNYFQGDLEDKHKVKRGDLLFAWSGTPGTSFGAHIWQGGAAALNQHIFRIDFDSSQIDPAYFRLALNQNVARYVEQAQGGVGLAHITKGKFTASQILLPPLVEQEHLVVEIERRLSVAAEVFAQIVANLRRAERLRQSVLANAFRVASANAEIDITDNSRIREMANQKLPALPASRKSEAEDLRQDLAEILSRYTEGISAESLFREAGYQGDQIDAFYRDLSRLADRLDLTFPDSDGAHWPMSGPVNVRLKR